MLALAGSGLTAPKPSSFVPGNRQKYWPDEGGEQFSKFEKSEDKNLRGRTFEEMKAYYDDQYENGTRLNSRIYFDEL